MGYAIYSGVLVERVENTVEIMPYVNGAIYNVNDVVVNIEDNMFYQYKMTTVPTRWSNATFYIVGSEVVYKTPFSVWHLVIIKCSFSSLISSNFPKVI